MTTKPITQRERHPSRLLLTESVSLGNQSAHRQRYFADLHQTPLKQLELFPPNPILAILARFHQFVRQHQNFRLKVLKRVSSITHQNGIRTKISFPIIEVSSNSINASSKPLILISAGMHGSETESCFGLCRFVEQHLPRLSNDFDFLLFPVVNPRGAFQNTRGNPNWNLNTTFTTAPHDHTAETRAIMQSLGNLTAPPLLSIDLHADDAQGEDFYSKAPATFTAPGIYIYEQVQRLALGISKAALAKVKDTFPVVQDPFIYGHPADGGVIQTIVHPRKKLLGDFESFMARPKKVNGGKIFAAPISLTVEIPNTKTAELSAQMYTEVLRALMEELKLRVLKESKKRSDLTQQH